MIEVVRGFDFITLIWNIELFYLGCFFCLFLVINEKVVIK